MAAGRARALQRIRTDVGNLNIKVEQAILASKLNQTEHNQLRPTLSDDESRIFNTYLIPIEDKDVLNSLNKIKDQLQGQLNAIDTLIATHTTINPISEAEITTSSQEYENSKAQFEPISSTINSKQFIYEQLKQIRSLTLSNNPEIQAFEISHLKKLAEASSDAKIRTTLREIHRQATQPGYTLKGASNIEIIFIGHEAAQHIHQLAAMKYRQLNAEMRVANAQKILQEINAFNPAPENLIVVLRAFNDLSSQHSNLEKIDYIENHKANFGISATSSIESIRGLEREISDIFTALETKRIALNAAQIQANLDRLSVDIRNTPENNKATLNALNQLTHSATDLATFNATLTNNQRRLGIADECKPALLQDEHKSNLTASLTARKKAFTIAVMQDGLASLPERTLAEPQLPGVLAELSSADTTLDRKNQLLTINQELLNIDPACEIVGLDNADIRSFTDSTVFKGTRARVFKIQVTDALYRFANTRDLAQQKLALALFNGIQEAADNANAIRGLLNANRGLLGIQQEITRDLLTDVAARGLRNFDKFKEGHTKLNNIILIHEINEHRPRDREATLNALLDTLNYDNDRNTFVRKINTHANALGIGQDPQAITNPDKLEGETLRTFINSVILKIQTLHNEKITERLVALAPGVDATQQKNRLIALTEIIQANAANVNDKILAHNDTLELRLNRVALNRLDPVNSRDIATIKNLATQKKVTFAIPYIQTLIENTTLANINSLKPVADARGEAALRSTIATLCSFDTVGLSLNELETLQTEAITKLADSQPYYALMLKAPINSPLQQALDIPGVKAAIETYTAAAAPADIATFTATLTDPTKTKAEITAALVGTNQFGAAPPLVDPAPLAKQLFAENQLQPLLKDDTLPRDVKQALTRRRGDGVADNQVLHKLGEKETPDDVNRIVKQMKETEYSEVMVSALEGLGLEATAAIAQNQVNHGKVFRLLNANPFIAQLLIKIVEPGNRANPNLLFVPDHENAILARIGGLPPDTIKQLIKRVENSNRADIIDNLNALGIDLAQLTNPIVTNNVRDEKIAVLYAEKEFLRIRETIGPEFQKLLNKNAAVVKAKLAAPDRVIDPHAGDVLNTNKHLLSLFNAKNENDFKINCATILDIPIGDSDLSKVWKENNVLHTKTNLSQERMAQYRKLITTYTVIAHQGYKSQWDHKKIAEIKNNLNIIKTGFSKQQLQLQISIDKISDNYQRLTGRRTRLQKRLFEIDALLAEIKTTQAALEKIPAVLTELKLSEGSTQSVIIKPADLRANQTLQQAMEAKETAWQNPAAPAAPGAPAAPAANAGRNMLSILDTADKKTVGLLKDGEGCVSEFKTDQHITGNPPLTTYTFTTIDTTKNECKTEIRLPFPEFDPINYPPQKVGLFGPTLPHPAILEAAAGWVDEHLKINPFHGQPIVLSGHAFTPDELTAIIITLQLRLVPQNQIQLVDTVTIEKVTEKQVKAAQQQVNQGKFKLFDKLGRLSEKKTTETEANANLNQTAKRNGGIQSP